MNFQELYNQAKEHKDNHKSCGGEPYKNYNELFEVVLDYFNNNFGVDLRILEIGTAVGFTTFILQQAITSPSKAGGVIDTIEFHQDHIDIAKDNIKKWGGDISKINFYCGDATNILPSLPPCLAGGYNVIFFDGYGAKLLFYKEFERLLLIGGLLITANRHLKSTETEYFSEFNNNKKWEFVREFNDTIIYRKLC